MAYPELFKLIDNADAIVFFGGAGVSTESGIPDFRGASGIYLNSKTSVPPETIVSADYFYSYTAEFYDFYKSKMLFPNAKPNSTHKYFASLESSGKNVTVITQNIDGLHQAAGSKNVIELHGSAHRNRCTRCGKRFGLDYIVSSPSVPVCDKCGGVIKPEVVLYGEQLNSSDITAAISALRECDLLIIAGTSLSVYPAASFITYAEHAKTVIINKTPTPSDGTADLVINDSLGNVFG